MKDLVERLEITASIYKESGLGTAELFLEAAAEIERLRAERAIEGLRHAVYVCETRKSAFKVAGYNVACDEIKLFIEAAIERVQAGEERAATCSVSGRALRGNARE